MNLVILQVVVTVASFIVFIGILFWAYSGSRKTKFDELGYLPLEEREPGDDVNSAENRSHSEHAHV